MWDKISLEKVGAAFLTKKEEFGTPKYLGQVIKSWILGVAGSGIVGTFVVIVIFTIREILRML